MRWRRRGSPFQRNAVFNRRTWPLVHLTICSLRIRWSQRITPPVPKTIHSHVPRPPPKTSRFNKLWKRYKIRAVDAPYRRAVAPKRRGSCRAAVRARAVTILVCDLFARIRADRAFAQPCGRRVVAGLIGATLSFITTAAWAEGPPKFSSSQLEPMKWSELAGWTADDHLAAFAAYQTSCQALLKIRRSDERAELSGALSSVCRKAAA